MAETSYPFDAGAGATVNEAQWQAMARRFRQTGVIDGSLNELAVSADGSAMSVSVATGDAFVEGFFYRNDAAKAMTISTAHATLGRIDTVVVRLDRLANTATLVVVAGTAAASPVAPTLSQTDTLYELPLANVQVDAAVGVITAGKVTDRRTLTQTFDSTAYVPQPASPTALYLIRRNAANNGFEYVAPTASSFVGARVHKSATQSLTTGTWTALAWPAETADTSNFHDTVTNNSRLTIPTTGWYSITASVGYALNATGIRGLDVRLNGTTYLADSGFIASCGASATTKTHVAVKSLLTAGDYVEIMGHQTSGGALDVVAGPEISYADIEFLGA